MISNTGKKIKESRIKKGLSQEELADLAKINVRTVQRIEKNINKPSGKTLNLICDALDISVLDFENHYNKENNKYSILSIVLTLILLVGTLINWYTFTTFSLTVEQSFNFGDYTGTGWNGYVNFYNLKINNWAISLCSLSVGGIVICNHFELIETKIEYILSQLILISLYFLVLVYLFLNLEKIYLGPGLFLVFLSTIGLVILFKKHHLKKKQ